MQNNDQNKVNIDQMLKLNVSFSFRPIILLFNTLMDGNPSSSEFVGGRLPCNCF